MAQLLAFLRQLITLNPASFALDASVAEVTGSVCPVASPVVFQRGGMA